MLEIYVKHDSLDIPQMYAKCMIINSAPND